MRITANIFGSECKYGKGARVANTSRFHRILFVQFIVFG